MIKIVYVFCGPNLAQVFLPIAHAFRKLYPDSQNICVDPSDILYKHFDKSPIADLFTRHGFNAEKISHKDFAESQSLDYKSKAYLLYFRLFERIKPSVVIVPHELGYAFYAVQAAKILGIPTCHVQHGIGESREQSVLNVIQPRLSYRERIFRLYMKLKGRIYSAIIERPYAHPELARFKDKLIGEEEVEPMNADRFLISGNYHKELLLAQRPEINENRIDVVGYLRNDYFHNNPIDPIETIYKRYDLDVDKRLAVYFYTPFQDLPSVFKLKYHPDDVLVDAIRTLKELDKNWNVLVLLHGVYDYGHNREKLNKLMQKHKFDSVKISRTHNDHFSLYKHASIIIGVSSSVLYEAMLANRPIIIQAYVLSEFNDVRLIEDCVAIPVLSPFSLQRQLNRALNDEPFLERLYENQRDTCRDLLGPFDGKCGERAVAAIAGLIREREGPFHAE